jgi:hypothetical protein
MKKVISLLLLLLTISLFHSCKEECKTTLSILSITNITATTASSGGNIIIKDCNSDIFVRGVCFSTDKTPTIDDARTADGYGKGTFTSSLIGLIPNTLYYVRAYAVNIEGITFSNQLTFTTLN